MVQRVLVAIDGSEPATAALEYALSQFGDAESTAFHVMDIVDDDDIRQRVLPTECARQRDAAERTAEAVLRNARTSADAAGVEIVTVTAAGRPARQILTYADRNAIDTIVMGTHGRSGLDRLLRGSISDLVRYQSAVPVVTVPNPATDPRYSRRDRHGGTREYPSVTGADKPPPALRWCPSCTVALYTRLEFCPGCLGETVPPSTS